MTGSVRRILELHVALTAITTAPLDAAALAGALDATGIGAVATFVGLVRDHNLGRKVLHLDTRPTSRWRCAGSS